MDIATPDLYPAIEPYRNGTMTRGQHRIYWELCGRPDGYPAVFLHGGPGAGAGPDHRRFFDPSHYNFLIFDQRGAGRSMPLAETSENTTADLIADIEALREMLGCERWLVFGGSWGSTLALAYAEEHPERVSALVLRGIFLCRKSEIDWFLYGIRNIFPDAWDRFVAPIPESERSDLLAAYHRRLMDPDPAVHLPVARTWSTYEGACSTLMPSPETVAAFGRDRMALGIARLEAHYFINGVFLPENALLERVERIRHIPGVIVQGRYDIVCPPVTAETLHQAWPEAQYQIVPDAGHSAMEPGIRRALVAATEHFKTLD